MWMMMNTTKRTPVPILGMKLNITKVVTNMMI